MNSLQILSYLLSAAKRTANTSFFEEAYEKLATEFDYKDNVMHHPRVTAIWNLNYSDDELAFLAYHLFLTSILKDEHFEMIKKSLINYFPIIRDEKVRYMPCYV